VCPIKPLEIDTKQEGVATVVTLSGHIATAESQVVSETFERLIADGVVKICVDMQGIDIITSDGLGALIRARKAASDNAGQLVLACVEGNILDIFRMTRLDKIFSLFDSVETALASLAG